MSENERTSTVLTPEQQVLNNLWEEHVRSEFATRDTDATLHTMVANAYVNHVPVIDWWRRSRGTARVLLAALKHKFSLCGFRYQYSIFTLALLIDLYVASLLLRP